MTIHIPADLEADIRRRVDSGAFSDPVAVIREALRSLDEQERPLRAKLQVGIDQLDRGEGVEWTPELMEQIRQEAVELHRRGEKSHPDVSA
jgi:antitoxin ParD1/3/4